MFSSFQASCKRLFQCFGNLEELSVASNENAAPKKISPKSAEVLKSAACNSISPMVCGYSMKYKPINLKIPTDSGNSERLSWVGLANFV